MNDYIIISADTSKKLSLSVKEKMSMGYSLHTVVEMKTKKDGSKYYCQTMVKTGN